MRHQRKERPAFESLGRLEWEETPSCPVCHHRVGRIRFTKHMAGYALRFTECNECRCLYQSPRMTEDSLQRLYASQEFFEGGDKSLNYYSFLEGEAYLSRTARSRLTRIRRYANSGKLLEVACAAGFFIKEAKAAGFDVAGVEFSRPMAEWASKRWNVPIRATSIERIDLEDERYDVVASWGVFTILRDPVSVLRKYNGALRMNGILALNTYYYPNLWCRLWRGRWYILVLNTSQIFSKEALRSALTDNGFEVLSVARDRPYASLKYLAFQLLSHIPGGVHRRVFDRIGALNRIVFPVYAPDNLEWICRKVSNVTCRSAPP